MKIGFGRTTITPPVGFSLVGYFHYRRSTGIRDELCATSCFIEDKGTLFAVISTDLIWLSGETVKKIRERISKEIDISPNNILVHATHTHTGPVPDDSGGAAYKKGFYVEPCYMEMLPLYIAGSAKIAYAKMRESSVGFASGDASGLAFNRRYILKDGRVVTNPWDRVKDIVSAAGPVDATLGVVKVTDKKTGLMTGIILNFACHPDTLGDTLISGDWPGMLRYKLKVLYPDADILVLNGPSGDINHINPADPGKRGLQIPEHIAETLKKKTVQLLREPEYENLSGLQVYSKKFSIPATEVSLPEFKKATEVLKNKDLLKDSLQYMVSAAQVKAYRERKKGKKSIRIEINGCSFGKELLLLGLPGEIFTAISLQIKKTSPYKHTLIAQNSNTHLGYVPSVTAFLHDAQNKVIRPGYGTKSLAEAIGIDCSYETTPFACRIGKNTEKRILKAVQSLL